MSVLNTLHRGSHLRHVQEHSYSRANTCHHLIAPVCMFSAGFWRPDYRPLKQLLSMSPLHKWVGPKGRSYRIYGLNVTPGDCRRSLLVRPGPPKTQGAPKPWKALGTQGHVRACETQHAPDPEELQLLEGRRSTLFFKSMPLCLFLFKVKI